MSLLFFFFFAIRLFKFLMSLNCFGLKVPENAYILVNRHSVTNRSKKGQRTVSKDEKRSHLRKVTRSEFFFKHLTGRITDSEFIGLRF